MEYNGTYKSMSIMLSVYISHIFTPWKRDFVYFVDKMVLELPRLHPLSQLWMFLLTSAFCRGTLVAWNLPWWEALLLFLYPNSFFIFLSNSLRVMHVAINFWDFIGYQELTVHLNYLNVLIYSEISIEYTQHGRCAF